MSLEDTIKSQLTRGYRYCSERPAERVFQSRGQIVGQTELDPEADDLAFVASRGEYLAFVGLADGRRWRDNGTGRQRLGEAGVAEKEHRGN